MNFHIPKEKMKYVLIGIVLLIAIIIYFMLPPKQIGIAGIPDPVQTELKKPTIFTKEIGGYNVSFTCLYEYEIEALVVGTESYWGGGIGDELAPRDYALAWGPVAEYNDRIDFNWSQSGRWYYWRVDSYDEIAPVGGPDGVSTHSANNHLIGIEQSVKDDLKRIKVGDHIVLKGYLVNIFGSNPDGETFTWNSSTTREDTGDGACEVMYVTKVTWRNE